MSVLHFPGRWEPPEAAAEKRTPDGMAMCPGWFSGGWGGFRCLANLTQNLNVRSGACLTQVTAPRNSPSGSIMGSYRQSNAQNTLLLLMSE